MNRKIVFASTIFLVHTIFSMQPDEKTKIFSSQEVVLNLVVVHYLFDHEATCSFAGTCKQHNKLMLATANNRKCELLVCPERYPFGNFIHKYGTASYWAYKRSDTSQLVLVYCQLKNEKPALEGHVFSGFISPLLHKPKPSFDGNGNLRFYGCGDKKYRYKDDEAQGRIITGVLAYSLDGSARQCVIQCDDQLWDVSYFLSYGSLLESILASNGEDITHDTGNYLLSCLSYSLDALSISADYKKKVEFYLPADCKLSIDSFAKLSFEADIPSWLRDAIERRYQECQNEKKLK